MKLKNYINHNNPSLIGKYRTSILTTGSLIIVIVLISAVFEFDWHRKEEVKQAEEILLNRAAAIDAIVQSTTDRVSELRYFTENKLTQEKKSGGFRPEELFYESSDSIYFYIKPRDADYDYKQDGLVHGQGGVQKRSTEFYCELNVMLQVLPLLKAIKQTTPYLAWVYYFSKNRISVVNPGDDLQNFLSNLGVSFQEYYSSIYNSEWWQQGIPENNLEGDAYWTSVYLDHAGKGLMISYGIPIYIDKSFFGIVAADITLKFLNDFLKKSYYPKGLFLVLNDSQQILGTSTGIDSQRESIPVLPEFLPEPLQEKYLSIQLDSNRKYQRLANYNILKTRLSGLPCTLFYIIPESDILYTMLPSFMLHACVVGGILLFMMVMYRKMQFSYLKPALALVEHIRKEVQNLPASIPKVPFFWQQWFESVSKSFNVTRTLNKELGLLIERQKETAQKLLESEGKYRQLFTNAIDAISIFDIESGKILDINNAFLKMYGCSRQEALQLTTVQMSAEPEKTKEVIRKAAENGKDICIPVRLHRRKDGSTIVVEISAGPFFWQGRRVMYAVARDITERKKAIEERHLLVTAIEQGADSIIITDREGNIQYVNPGFERISGYKRGEVLKKNPRILQSGKHDVVFYKKMWETLGNKKVWSGRFVNKKKDGSFYEEDASISPILDDKEDIIHYVAVKRDVTDQVALENKLRQAQKLESIGTLAGGIAHDFNNILTAILGYADLVLDELSYGSDLWQNQQQVLKAGFRAKELVKQILAFSRRAKADTIPLQPIPTIKEALKLLRASIPTTIELQQDIDPDCGQIVADPTQLYQIVMNLCTNAFHAMRKTGGILRVKVQSTLIKQNDSRVQGFDWEPGPYFKLEISDTGVGIAPQMVEKIFDPYFTTKEKEEGTGLGLSVVHGIVKSNNGHITVSSTVGKGTTFHVYLPQLLFDTIPEKKEETEVYLGGTENILLVDDEEIIVEVQALILQSFGYRVSMYFSSSEALETFRNAPDNFDLVITDMTMPNMTGAELSKELLSIRPDIPIILCTGYNELIDNDKAKSLGIREYILKPVSKMVLAKMVRKVLDNKGMEI